MRCVLVLACLLLPACEAVYLRADHSGRVASQQISRSASRGPGSEDCARDAQACPAPPRPYDPTETHLPSLLPYSPGPGVPSYD